MLISDVIQRIKHSCNDIDAFNHQLIEESTTRDKVLYGNVKQECSGIVTCIWPAANVIRQAQKLGANLIVTHEALFWNHGDHQEPLAGNNVFREKKALLDSWGGAVWRCHDYIHAGVPIPSEPSPVDGIFYGFAWKLGWINYRVGDHARCLDYEIPETSAEDLAAHITSKLGLAGVRIVGNPTASIHRIRIPVHVVGGPQDTELSNAIDREDIDCILGMEFIDFTTCEYIRDAAMLGKNKCAIVIGHFNLEEPGMEYMAEWLPAVMTGEIAEKLPAVTYVPDGDTYRYMIVS